MEHLSPSIRRVAILCGGVSEEHIISLRSAQSFIQHIDSEYELFVIVIDTTGKWSLIDPTMVDLVRKGANLSIDGGSDVSLVPGKGIMADGELLDIQMVIPVLHGTGGEDGVIQGILEALDIPYVGARLQGSVVAMDKDLTKTLLETKGFPVVPWLRIHEHELEDGGMELFITAVGAKLGYPCFVKPARNGSSVGVHKVDRAEDLASALKEALDHDSKVIVEKAIKAREIECAVLGNHSLATFPLAEIESTHVFYDYEAKYEDPNGAMYHLPAPLTRQLTETIQTMAEDIFKTLELQGLARVDFFYDQGHDHLYLNEVNTFPGFTSTSMYPRMAQEGKLNYAELIEELMALGLEMWRAKRRLATSG